MPDGGAPETPRTAAGPQKLGWEVYPGIQPEQWWEKWVGRDPSAYLMRHVPDQEDAMTARKRFLDLIAPHVDAEQVAWHLDAIESEARAEALREVGERVEALIADAGGRCRVPDDFDPGEINICEQHSELLFDTHCEDQPHQLLAVIEVLAAITPSPATPEEPKP